MSIPRIRAWARAYRECPQIDLRTRHATSSMRLTERDLVAHVLRLLDKPYVWLENDDPKLFRLCLTEDDWRRVKKILGKTSVMDILEAWRHLPEDIWKEYRWIDLVCRRLAEFAPDYEQRVNGTTKRKSQ